MHSTPCFTLFCTSFVSLDSTHGVIHMSLYTIQSITGSPERSIHRVPVIRPQSRIRCCLRWTGHGEHVVLWGYKYDGCSPAYHQKPSPSEPRFTCITWTEFFANTNYLSRTNSETSEVHCPFLWSCNIIRAIEQES